MTQTAIQNIQITRGDDYDATITFDQNISDYEELRFTVRTDWATTETNNDDAVYTTELTGASSLTATLTIPSASTSIWTLPLYVYDIQVTSATGAKYTTQRGKIRMGPDVTR